MISEVKGKYFILDIGKMCSNNLGGVCLKTFFLVIKITTKCADYPVFRIRVI